MAESIFFRRHEPDQGVMTDRHKQIIGVVGVGSGAGATFVAMALAVKMAEMTEGVTFFDGGQQGEGTVTARELLGTDSRFRKLEKGGGSRALLHRRVNWVLQGPGPGVVAPGAGAPQESHVAPDCRLLAGRHIIVDSPRNPEDMDIIICVVDPLPSRITAGLETFRRIKEQSLVPVIWLLNKNNSNISRREVESFLRTRFTHTIPLLPGEVFYRAEFCCSQPVFGQGMSGIEEAVSALAEEILLHN